MPFLFTSAQLTVLLEITPSVKTRLAMIMMLGPRLTDPRTKVEREGAGSAKSSHTRIVFVSLSTVWS